MSALSEEVKEELRQIQEIDQERLRLLIRRQQVVREIKVLEDKENKAEVQA